MADTKKWPLSARPMGMGGTGGGGKTKGKRRNVSAAPAKRTRSPESIAKGKATRAANKKADKKAGGRGNRLTAQLQRAGKLPDLGNL